MQLIEDTNHLTNEYYSPHDLLPAPIPAESVYPARYFYNNVAKHLIKDTVRIMANGLHIDLEKVSELEETLDSQLEGVARILANNPVIAEFQKLQHSKLINNYIKERTSKLKSAEDFIKPFKNKDAIHRSYFMHLFAQAKGIELSDNYIENTAITKWDARTIKGHSSSHIVLKRLLDNESMAGNEIAREAMLLLAKHKCDMHNRKYEAQIANPEVDVPPFNPGSSQQKQQLFEWLGIQSEATTDSGAPQWDRDQVELLHKRLDDPVLKEITQAMIDYSTAAIIRNNFIKAFYNYTVDNRLHGNYKLFGAKSFRMSSNSPNMLNTPSTGSIFAKPMKKCFTAAPNHVILAIDLASLEDKVIANLSHDVNKTILQTDKELDAHLFHATIYFKDKFEAILGTGMSHRELTVAAVQAMAEGNKEIKELRQQSKGVTFGASYGAFPPKIASSIKCSLAEAEQIFNAYHNDMYPGITKYREEYVLPTAKAEGRIHLGLGCYIHTSNASRDIRTLANATVQYWSILTILAINKFHQFIDNNNLADKVRVISTIYDSIYIECYADPNIIKVVNDTMTELLLAQYLVDEPIRNEADMEIGINWADLHKLPYKSTVEEITTILNEVLNND